jgi:hypothetical protein
MKNTHHDSLAPKKQEHMELADIFRLNLPQISRHTEEQI